MKRKRILKETESEILLKSGRRCCLCYGLYGDFKVKRGQLAHVNRDSSNSEFDNLAFLCLEHHDIYDSRTSQSKSITESEVKFYRNILYKDVENQLPRLEKQIESSEKEKIDQIEAFHSFIESLRGLQSISSSILNDYEIDKSIDSGFLGIDPFNKSQLSLSSYEFSLGEKALIEGKIFDVTPNTPLLLKKKTFALIETNEFISMPNGLIGHVHPLASLSRIGISVHSGARIDSIWQGRLFVGIENIGNNNVRIDFGSVIFSMEFMLLNIAPKKYHEERYSTRIDILKKLGNFSCPSASAAELGLCKQMETKK